MTTLDVLGGGGLQEPPRSRFWATVQPVAALTVTSEEIEFPFPL